MATEHEIRTQYFDLAGVEVPAAEATAVDENGDLLHDDLSPSHSCSVDGSPVFITASGTAERAHCALGHRWQQSFNGALGWIALPG